MKIWYSKSDPNNMQEKLKKQYISLDIFFTTLVSDARSNQVKQSEILEKECK